ncbi:MAG TPA: hypothetical protein VMZ69_08865 [Saprospiraceae bacterium]|nr:hypothetical protein [Saprospiraceae bacterium]
MKTAALGLYLVLSILNVNAQTVKATDQVIEGGKVFVELIKVLRGSKEQENNRGCKGLFADLCVLNESSSPISVVLVHRNSAEKREMVIQPQMNECCLRIAVGVWTYDLRTIINPQSIRKGDLLIEGCQNLSMNVKY